jgi:hypothetical protein
MWWRDDPNGVSGGTTSLAMALCRFCAIEDILIDEVPTQAFGRVCETEWTCPAGHSCSGSVQTRCPAGTYSTAGANVCTACPAGTYSTTGGATSIASCVVCPSGTVSSSSGSTSCSPCPLYTSSSVSGAFKCLPQCPVVSTLSIG